MFTPESRHALLFAQRKAAARHMQSIGVSDVAHGALADGVWASTLLTSIGLDPDEVMKHFEPKQRSRFYESAVPTEFTPQTRKALTRSKKLALRYDHAVITTAHILVACLTVGDPEVNQVGADFNLDPADLASELESRFGLEL
jgi:ATP-dependent Clp protease ATP-binding subunit ClpA